MECIQDFHRRSVASDSSSTRVRYSQSGIIVGHACTSRVRESVYVNESGRVRGWAICQITHKRSRGSANPLTIDAKGNGRTLYIIDDSFRYHHCASRIVPASIGSTARGNARMVRLSQLCPGTSFSQITTQ